MGVDKIKRWFTEGNVPVKIGVLVLFAGVAALLKYATDQGWLNAPIELRLAGVAGAAIAALVFGWRKREANRVFALSLQGGAIGILLLVVFAAFKLYGLMPASVGFALSVVIVAGAGVLAVVQNAKALALLRHPRRFPRAALAVDRQRQPRRAVRVLRGAQRGDLRDRVVESWRALNLLGFAFTFGIGTRGACWITQPDKFAHDRAVPAAVLRVLSADPARACDAAADGAARSRRRHARVRHAAGGFALQAGLMRGGADAAGVRCACAGA